jgi:predicted transcriptional regulator
VKDIKNRFWEYTPINRDQLNSIEFSLPIPKDDGPNSFVFSIFGSPPGANIEGEAKFDLIVDTTAPSVTDFRSSIHGDEIEMSWAFLEVGSGLDTSTLEYSIFRNDMIHVPWTSIINPYIKDGRLWIKISDLSGDDLEIKLRMADRVGNDHSTDQVFIITPDPVPAHDVSIGEVDINPDIVLINQVIGFSSMVHNHGTEDESDLQVEIQRNDEVLTYIDVADLPAGSSREIRWTWKAVDGTSEFKIIIDPQNRINDDDLTDNEIKFIIEPEYLDIKAREDYLLTSDPDAENMDLITLSFSIRSIGSIESGSIKVTFSQDGKYMGLYQLPSIYKEGSRELVVDWKVDSSVRNLTLMIDPYNEILESIEENNLVHFENPYFEVEKIPGKEIPEEDIEDEGALESGTMIQDEKENGDNGGTIFIGPEIEKENIENEVAPSIPVVVKPTPEDPEVLPPFILPTAGFIIGTSFLGLALFGLRSEMIRFKLLGLLIPLYSKIKKSKIEKGVRHEILGYLKAKPGANYSELKRNLDLNDGSLVHHLRILEREEKIYSKKMGKYKLFYVSAYRRQASIRDYISPFQLRIVELILENPGIVPKKLSNILDRSQTDMSYHLSELSRNGLLDKRKKGRNIHYYIADEYSDIMI